MSWLDDIINAIDDSIDLYGILKGMDEAFGEDIRRELEYEAGFWASPEGLLILAEIAKNPLKADWNFIKELIKRELKGRPVAPGTIPPWEKDKGEKAKPVHKSDPPPVSSGGGRGGNGGTVTPKPRPTGHPVKTKRPTVIPPKKLNPPKTGFTQSEDTKPITAEARIGSKEWGELICYCIEAKGITVANPVLDAQPTNDKAAKSLQALAGIISIDSMPASLPNKQAVKAKTSWWAHSALVAPSSIQGLVGDVSLIGGVDAIYDIAAAMSIASFNAYVGSASEFYIETQEITNSSQPSLTRTYADLPFLAGHNNMYYEIAVLKDRDIGVFMSVPYDQWLKATPKTGNLQLLFYGKKKPPYSDKKTESTPAKRYRPSEVNIPDPRELTWAQIKSVASQYTTGGHCCTIQLECGRPIVAWANSDSAAEDRARSLATLSTSPVTDKDPVFTIIKSKKTLTMYPGEAIYTVGGSSGKQKMKLWVDKVEDSGYDDALLKEEDLSTLT
jgi:hypothetical protein